jgi:hypothetical protein
MCRGQPDDLPFLDDVDQADVGSVLDHHLSELLQAFAKVEALGEELTRPQQHPEQVCQWLVRTLGPLQRP